MFKLTPNLDQEGKYIRIAVGAILIIGGILGLGRIFLLLIGVVLVVEGLLGWGGIPALMEKFLKSPPKTPGNPPK